MQPLYKFIIDRLLLRGGGTPAATTKGSSLRDVFGGIGGMGSRPFSTLGDQRQQMAAFVDWVYGAEQLIAEDVATIDFQVYVNRTSTKSRALVARSVLHPREFKALGKRRVEIRTKDFMGQAITEAAPAMQAARFLEAAVVAGLNIIVAGGTQAGKTTMLNCLADAIPDRERVVTCKEVFELANATFNQT